MGWCDAVAVSFDLGGTLIDDPHGPATQEIGDLLGVGLLAMRTYLGRDAKRSRQGPAQLARRLSADFRRPDAEGPLNRLLEHRRAACARPTILPGVEAILAELRRRGFRVALLSNILGAIAPRPDSHRIFGMVDAVLLSCDTGHIKPERQAFVDVERALGAGPHQLVHVGDSPGADVRGALAAGWNAVHLGSGGPIASLMNDDRYRWRPDLSSLLDLFGRRLGCGT